MASVFCPGVYDIDYSLVDGRVRFFQYGEHVLYDEDINDNYGNWEKKLIEVVENYGLNKNDGRGYHAFTHKLAEEGKVKLK